MQAIASKRKLKEQPEVATYLVPSPCEFPRFFAKQKMRAVASKRKLEEQPKVATGFSNLFSNRDYRVEPDNDTMSCRIMTVSVRVPTFFCRAKNASHREQVETRRATGGCGVFFGSLKRTPDFNLIQQCGKGADHRKNPFWLS